MLKKKNSDRERVGGAEGTKGQPCGSTLSHRLSELRSWLLSSCWNYFFVLHPLYQPHPVKNQVFQVYNLKISSICFHTFLPSLPTVDYLIHHASTVFSTSVRLEVCLRPLLHLACPLHLNCQNKRHILPVSAAQLDIEVHC